MIHQDIRTCSTLMLGRGFMVRIVNMQYLEHRVQRYIEWS